MRSSNAQQLLLLKRKLTDCFSFPPTAIEALIIFLSSEEKEKESCPKDLQKNLKAKLVLMNSRPDDWSGGCVAQR